MWLVAYGSSENIYMSSMTRSFVESMSSILNISRIPRKSGMDIFKEHSTQDTCYDMEKLADKEFRLSETSQSQNDDCMIPFIWGI